MSAGRTFGELRSLLSQAPSEALWERVCALCDAEVARDAGRFEAEVLPYVLGGLLEWPDRLRIAPRGWVDAIVKEGTHPCGPLVRWIDLDWRPTHDRGRLMNAQERAQLLTAQERARLRAAPCLAQVAELSLEAVGVQRLEQLEGASMLKTLRVLELSNTGAEGADGIFAQLTALTTLRASFGKALRSSALLIEDALVASGRLPALEVLWMGGMGLNEARAARLGVCTRLRELAVWSNEGLGDAGVAALCEALRGAPLAYLHVGGCGLTSASVAMIAAAPWRLEQLWIWKNALSDEAAVLLGGHEAFGALRVLNVSETRLSGWALAPLLSRRGAQPLRELWCGELPELGAESWRAAALGDTARGLEMLHARQTKLGARGALEALLEGMDSGRMQRLLIPENTLGAAHMLALRDARLPDLRTLELNSNPIGDAGLEVVLAAGWMEGLEVLKVSGCGLSMAAVDMLRAHAPRLGALCELHIQVDGVADEVMREAICGALPGLTLRMRSWG